MGQSLFKLNLQPGLRLDSSAVGVGGDLGAIRTRDPQIRNLMLYPAELRGLKKASSAVGKRAVALRNLGQLFPRCNSPLQTGCSRDKLRSLRLSPLWPKYLWIRSKVDPGCMVLLETRTDCAEAPDEQGGAAPSGRRGA